MGRPRADTSIYNRVSDWLGKNIEPLGIYDFEWLIDSLEIYGISRDDRDITFGSNSITSSAATPREMRKDVVRHRP